MPEPAPALFAPLDGGPLLGPLDGARILVVRFSGLGDVVLTLPAIHALRRAFPRAHIAWLVADSCRTIPELCPDVDAVLPLRLTSSTDRAATVVRRLRAARDYATEWIRMAHAFAETRYDVVVEFQNLFKCAAFGVLNRGAVRVGFKGGGEPTHWLLHHAPVRKDTTQHSVRNYLRLTTALGAAAEPVEFPLAIPAEATARAGIALGAAGVSSDARLALLSPFGRRASKLWPLERFAAVAREVHAATGTRFVCAPAPTDVAPARAMAAQAAGAITVLEGLGLPELCALLRRAVCFLGIDGGPMHVAGALGTPVCAVYGATNRQWIGPWGEVAGPDPATGLPRAVVVQAPGAAPDDPTTRSARRRAWTDRTAIEAIEPAHVRNALMRAYEPLLRGEIARATATSP